MNSPSTNESSTTEHNHYWPDGLVPITPQARSYGFTMDVYLTRRGWSRYCAWTKGKNTNTDKRVYELLESCFHGLGKALAKDDDMVAFMFKHYFWGKDRDRAKKKLGEKLGARLMLHPETGVPWLMIFNPEFDFADQLKKGDPPDGTTESDREADNESGTDGPSNDPGLDPGDRD